MLAPAALLVMALLIPALAVLAAPEEATPAVAFLAVALLLMPPFLAMTAPEQTAATTVSIVSHDAAPFRRGRCCRTRQHAVAAYCARKRFGGLM